MTINEERIKEFAKISNWCWGSWRNAINNDRGWDARS